MRSLTLGTSGLVGAREPAQPLLTYYDGPARVELSGSTTANWVAKTANLLVDGYENPARVGVLLPLHWHFVVTLLAGVATGATVVVAAEPADLAGCDLAFVHAPQAEAARDLGVDEVLALSGHPLGVPLPSVPSMVADYAREVPSYADHFGGPTPPTARIELAGQSVALPAPDGWTAADRVLTDGSPASPAGLAALLRALQAGASLVLVTGAVDLAAVTAAERTTRDLTTAR